MSRKTFICEVCKAPVKDSLDRFEISEDAMREDGKKRLYRISLKRLCRQHAEEREAKLRPKGPNTGNLF